MARIALALDARTEDRLIDGLVAHDHSVRARAQSATELHAVARSGEVDVILALAGPRLVTAEVLSVCDEAGVRIIAFTSDEAERRHVASIGLYEVLNVTAEWHLVEALIVSPVTPQVRTDDTGSTGRVIAVWGPPGSPGRTSLAINVAAELAALGRTVVLADADTYSSSVAPQLGLLDEAPGFAAACRLAGSHSLDRGELERVAQRYDTHKASFRVLTGIARSNRWPELSADRVERVLDACRTWVDDVVVDTASNIEADEEISTDLFAPRRNAATLASLRNADRIVTVGLADPLGVSRFIRGHAELLEVVSPRLDVVMNRVRPGALGLGAESQVRSTLSRFAAIDRVDFVPDDQRNFDAAVLAGRALRDVSPRSTARLAIERYVIEHLVPNTVSGTRRATKARRRGDANVTRRVALGTLSKSNQ